MDRVIEDEVLSQDRVVSLEFHRVTVADQLPMVPNWMPQPEQQPLLEHEIVVELHFIKREKKKQKQTKFPNRSFSISADNIEQKKNLFFVSIQQKR